MGRERQKKRTKGTSLRPRLVVYRSARHIYAQIVDDTIGKTLCGTSTLSLELRGELKSTSNMEAAAKVGQLIAQKTLAKGIKKVVFDRNGFLYHGRVKTLAASAREKGLEF